MLQRGLNVENILLDELGNVDGHMVYQPLEDPLNNQSTPVTINLTMFTGNTDQCHIHDAFCQLASTEFGTYCIKAILSNLIAVLLYLC